MTDIRSDKLNQCLDECISSINRFGLLREEAILLLGHLVTRVGYSIYTKNERPEAEIPTTIDSATADKLALDDPTLGTVLIKLGFDMLRNLLMREESGKGSLNAEKAS